MKYKFVPREEREPKKEEKGLYTKELKIEKETKDVDNKRRRKRTSDTDSSGDQDVPE